MREPSQEQLDNALELHQSGEKMKMILEITGLNYSQAWLYITDAEMPPEDRIDDPHRTAATVRRLRDSEKCSWGLISVRFGYHEFPETKIRKLYEDVSGIRSQGLRIGRGGMHFARDPRLYKGQRRRTGIQIASGVTRMEVEEHARTLGEADMAIGVRSNGQKPAPVTKKAVAKRAGVVKKAVKAQPVKKATKRTGKAG